ncbi:TetR/AcrR family transcriptional regulator [Ferrimonas balearica]|uniref:TetR/AcrR family transcriptional regulator n=1 Tax=Ferrimonas balearica TaxID=44012 RepID=UPI001F2EB6DA|nr:TetR/AcrR family transcriptional regulator [Ferrimonas balearica]MBY6018409.1 TetR/AcrR family transcriptional regulator [Halomonas denitrificans]MBY6094762.1 TetR/AcrR family transcriptional regulator [Ferrimonas balearica]
MRPTTQAKQQKILEVATEQFLSQGYKDTSLDQIVALTGGSKQTLYRYFGNKEGLFEAVLNLHTQRVAERFRFDPDSTKPVARQLADFGHLYLVQICTQPMVGLLRIIASDFSQHPEMANTFWQGCPQYSHRLLSQFLASDRVAAELAIEDPNFACDQLRALIKRDHHTLALLGKPLPDRAELDVEIQLAVATFMRLYRR